MLIFLLHGAVHARGAAHRLDDERGRGDRRLVRGEDGGGQVARDRLRRRDLVRVRVRVWVRVGVGVGVRVRARASDPNPNLVRRELRQRERDSARVVPVHVGVQQRGAHDGVPAVRLVLRGDDPREERLGGGGARGHAEGLHPRVDA